MMHKHTVDLLERLLAATQNDRIKWTEVPGKTAYSYLAGDFVVLIDTNTERTSFRLSDAKGRSLEQADTDDLNAASLKNGNTALSAVHSIHAIAKRQAMGTDEAIASVLGHLQHLDLNDEAKATEEANHEPKDLGHEISSEDEAVADVISPSDGGTEIAETPEAESQDTEATLAENAEDEPVEGIAEDHPVEESPAPVVEEASPEPTIKIKKKKRSLLNPFGGKK